MIWPARNMQRVGAALILLLTLGTRVGGVQASEKGKPGDTTIPDALRVRVMTFNVENLFDTVDDPRKADDTYLPLARKTGGQHKKRCATLKRAQWQRECKKLDWTEAVLIIKLKALATVIGAAKPDIVVLQEVENLQVLQRLQRALVPTVYRTAALIEGADYRGIDVGVLSVFPMKGAPHSHRIPFVEKDGQRLTDSREVLQVDLRLPLREVITVFGVHLPAPHHDIALRLQALGFLRQLQKGLPDGRRALVAGDFNIPTSEEQRHHIIDRHIAPHWLVTHRMGCADCLGTYFFRPKRRWSFLDMILVTKNFDRKPWRVDRGSIKVVRGQPEQSDRYGVPQAFDATTGRGVSDHWPLYVEIVYGGDA